MKFADLVKVKREVSNIKLKELEEITGITASYISRIEKGQINGVSGENVFKLAKALNISLSEVAESFNVKLMDNNQDNPLNKLKYKSDYLLVRQGIESIIDISNNETDYKNALDGLFKVIIGLKKSNMVIVGITNDNNADYVVEIQTNDTIIVEFVADKLREKLGAKTIVIEGNYINSDDVNLYELNDFIEDFVEDEDEKKEILTYIKKTK